MRTAKEKLWYGFGVCALVLLMALLSMLQGCSPAKRAIKHLNKGYALDELVAAKKCAMWFPIQETIKDSIVYTKGETQYRYDTVTVDCDSVVSATKKNQSLPSGAKVNQVKVPCPPCPLSVDTIRHYNRIIEQDTRQMAIMQADIDLYKSLAAKWEKKAEEVQKGKASWRIAAMVGWVLIMGLVAFKILKNRIP